MLKEQLLQMGLTEEQSDKVLGYHTESLAGYVPKEKLAESETDRLRLTDTLKERDEQLETLKKAAGTADVSGELRKQLEDTIAKNKVDTEKAAADFEAYKLKSAIKLVLAGEGARNTTAVMALLDMSNVKLDGESVLGLNDQLIRLRASDEYLFAPTLEGRQPYSGAKFNPDEYKDNPFKKETFNLTKQGQLLRENPELYNKLQAAAGVK